MLTLLLLFVPVNRTQQRNEYDRECFPFEIRQNKINWRWTVSIFAVEPNESLQMHLFTFSKKLNGLQLRLHNIINYVIPEWILISKQDKIDNCANGREIWMNEAHKNNCQFSLIDCIWYGKNFMSLWPGKQVRSNISILQRRAASYCMRNIM